jgi:hypothetical protein
LKKEDVTQNLYATSTWSLQHRDVSAEKNVGAVSRQLEAVILRAVFRPAKRDESKRRTHAFLASFPLRTESDVGKDWALLSAGMHRSFVGIPSLRAEIRVLGMKSNDDQQ